MTEAQNTTTANQKANSLQFANYIVGFVDILGQRAQYRDQNILPHFKSENEQSLFIKKARNTIGVIITLQNSAKQMVASARNYQPLYRDSLSKQKRLVYDAMNTDRLQMQYWSDGLVYFSSLETMADRTKMNDVSYLLRFIGHLCFGGLAMGHPVRGGVEIGWGVELHPGELYGCAVVKAYELEANIAQWPRVVVGKYALKYIKDILNTQPGSIYDVFNKSMAQMCLDLLAEDSDGQWIIDYLGAHSQHTNLREKYVSLYDTAHKFILKMMDECRKNNDTKLLPRYEHVLEYFLKHKLSG